jgi:hypothetical protein
MQSSKSKAIAAAATLFGGILAGVTANRALVEFPAWERIGVISWANFTRAENHGVGAFFYVVIGFLALFFTILTAIAFRFDRSARRSDSLPAYAAAVLAVIYAVITRAILVPAAFQMRAADSNSVNLQAIFSDVVRWSGVNDILHVFAFGFSLWAFAAIMARPERS